MRKLVVLGLIMVMVFAFSGIGAANWIGGLPFDKDEEVIDISAEVYPYVEFRGTADSLDFAEFEKIKLKGNEGVPYSTNEYDKDWKRWRSNDLSFYIASNFTVDFNMNISEQLNNGNEELDTKLWLFDQDFINNNNSWQGACMGATESNRTFSNIQGCELHQYKLRVEATLGDVHKQPAGDYSGTVTLTVGASGTV